MSSDVLDEAIHDCISDELIAPGPSLDVSFEIALRGSVGDLREPATIWMFLGLDVRFKSARQLKIWPDRSESRFFRTRS